MLFDLGSKSTQSRCGLLLVWGLVVWSLAAPAAGAQPAHTSEDRERLRARSESFEALARAVNASVVQVHARSYGGVRRTERRTEWADKQRGGSGVFVDSTGYLVTNAHVVNGAHSVQVELPGPQRGAPGEQSILRPRGEILEAEVVGTDRETDVAVLKVDLPRDQDRVPALSFGNSDELRPGQLVAAFGSPRGFKNSVSMGVVSATARQLRPESPMIYVQTDAPINPGSSGGPLVNVDGDIVGLNTLMFSSNGGYDGLGFAAPSNIVKAVYEQIREHGQVRRGVIGVHAQTITPELRRELGIDRRYRVILGDVRSGSPADRAGLRPGDVIAQLNGQRMENGRQLDVNLYSALGSIARLTVIRGDSTFTRSVRVVERPDPQGRFADMANADKHRIDRLEALVLPMSEEVVSLLPTSRRIGGVLVAASNRPPPPWGDHLQSGDVLSIVDGQPVETPNDLRRILQNQAPDSRVVAHVFRDGHYQFLVIAVD